MNYIEITINASNEEAADIAVAMLSDYPFDSFEQDEATVKAYIPESAHAEYRDDIERYLDGSKADYSVRTIEQRNWNEVWESNFEPIDVEGRCMIRAPFHEPSAAFEQEVVIMPKMSFGTGHHATTYLMVAEIMDNDLTDLTGLDMGSGTGVLAILAAKRGATHVDAIDIDPWSQENSAENIETNGVQGKVTPLLGDASLLAGRKYDFILANINRNILLADMESYVYSLNPGGFILFSGILDGDIEVISHKAISLGLRPADRRLRQDWAALKFTY